MKIATDIQIPAGIRRAAHATVRDNDAIEAVLLFGSRARGDHTDESDYDIALVTNPGLKRPPETAMPLCDKDLEEKYETQLAFISAEAIARHANTAGALASRIAREGVLIAGHWTRPQCRDGSELDIDTEQALRWADWAAETGTWALHWLQISSSETWPGDNQAATAVHITAERVTKGVLATFGVYETDIHDLDATADELQHAYRQSGWRQSERSDFANRIRALRSRGRAGVRAAKREVEDFFEPLTETIARIGRVWDLLIAWLDCFPEVHPGTARKVADAARKLKGSLPKDRLEPRDVTCAETGQELADGTQSVESSLTKDTRAEDRSSEQELAEHIRRTRDEAQRLIEKLEKGLKSD